MPARIALNRGEIADFARRWKIQEIALFGSVLREDFDSDSDVDVLATFAADAEWSLLDHVAMEDELSRIVGRKVDLVSRRGVEQSRNWIRRKHILESAEPYYVAG